jgi:hypothetical protein
MLSNSGAVMLNNAAPGMFNRLHCYPYLVSYRITA